MKKIFQKPSYNRISAVYVNPWYMPTTEAQYEVTITHTNGSIMHQTLSERKLREVQAAWKKGDMIPAPVSPWTIQSHCLVAAGSFISKPDYQSIEVLAPSMLERLQTLDEWTFEEIPEEGLIKAYYLALPHETEAHILFHKDADKIIIEVNRLSGDREPFNQLKITLKETFAADVPKKKAKKSALMPTEIARKLTPEKEKYLKALQLMTNTYADNLSMLFTDTQFVLRESVNDSHSHLLDDETCRENILSILKHALLNGPDSLALLACEQLYKRPAYQASFLKSPTLLTAIYEKACCNETYRTTKTKEISIQLLSELLVKDSKKVLSTLQKHAPKMTEQEVALAAGQTIISSAAPTFEGLDNEVFYDGEHFGDLDVDDFYSNPNAALGFFSGSAASDSEEETLSTTFSNAKF